MAKYGILLFAVSKERFRIVTHLDITQEMVEKTVSVLDGMAIPTR